MRPPPLFYDWTLSGLDLRRARLELRRRAGLLPVRLAPPLPPRTAPMLGEMG